MRAFAQALTDNAVVGWIALVTSFVTLLLVGVLRLAGLLPGASATGSPATKKARREPGLHGG